MFIVTVGTCEPLSSATLTLMAMASSSPEMAIFISEMPSTA